MCASKPPPGCCYKPRGVNTLCPPPTLPFDDAAHFPRPRGKWGLRGEAAMQRVAREGLHAAAWHVQERSGEAGAAAVTSAKLALPNEWHGRALSRSHSRVWYGTPPPEAGPETRMPRAAHTRGGVRRRARRDKPPPDGAHRGAARAASYQRLRPETRTREGILLCATRWAGRGA